MPRRCQGAILRVFGDCEAFEPYASPMSTSAAAPARSHAQIAFGVTALIAWFGMVLNFILTVLGTYPSLTTDPTLLGMNQPGMAGMLGRVFDFFTYFTILSNITVAVIMTMLWRDPKRTGVVFRTFFVDALLMISITGLIYGVVLAGSAKPQGLEHVTNAVEHYIVPLLVVIVFIVYGPRRLIKVGTVFAALIFPIAWAIFALVRGAIIGAYPYFFLDVATLGLGQVIINIILVAVLATLIGFIYLLIDKVRSRKA